MTDFEGINPYEYQKQAVAMQKQRIAEQPHLKPQIEKAQALTPVTKPRVEAPTMTGAKPTGAERIGAGVAASVGLGLATEAVKAAGFIAKETITTIARESLPGATRRPVSPLQRFLEPPPPMQPRQDASRLQSVRNDLTSITMTHATPNIEASHNVSSYAIKRAS